MKKMIAFLVIVPTFFIGCKKDSNGPNTLLRRVTESGKVNESFEYNNNNQLIKEKYYGFCATNPIDEHSYIYTNNKLDTLRSVIRSIYSSITAICNPLMGLHSYTVFGYDSQGRINTIKTANSSTTLFYNAQGLVEKRIINSGGPNNYISTYKYDTRGNQVEYTDGQGYTTLYEFDNKINPYFLIKRHPDISTAFDASPNNVTRISWTGGSSTIRYEYNSSGLPTRMFDSNGGTYEFEYN